MRRRLLLAAAMFSVRLAPASPQRDRPPRRDDRNRYSIEQATSDQAQLHTISFDGLDFRLVIWPSTRFCRRRSPTTSDFSTCGISRLTNGRGLQAQRNAEQPWS
jgi:hypothetical protein